MIKLYRSGEALKFNSLRAHTDLRNFDVARAQFELALPATYDAAWPHHQRLEDFRPGADLRVQITARHGNE